MQPSRDRIAAAPDQHLVQLYGTDTRELTRNVGAYLAEGLTRGEALLVLATAEHAFAFAQELREHRAYQGAVRQGHLVFLDADVMLRQLLVDGEPDAARFRSIVGGTIRELRSRVGTPLRAYGEMVGLLWQEGRCDAAIRLEEHWNNLLRGQDIQLFCGYPIDVCGDQFRAEAIGAVLCTHTQLVPAGDALDGAVQRAMEEVLGTGANEIRSLVDAERRAEWAELPPAEAALLWLQSNLPGAAKQILERARSYRRRAA